MAKRDSKLEKYKIKPEVEVQVDWSESEKVGQNAKTVLLQQWNPKFEDFFKQYGFIPGLCRPYRPQTKGKTENIVAYVRRDFFLGGCFSSVADINSEALTWLTRNTT
jgi:transposase